MFLFALRLVGEYESYISFDVSQEGLLETGLSWLDGGSSNAALAVAAADNNDGDPMAKVPLRSRFQCDQAVITTLLKRITGDASQIYYPT